MMNDTDITGASWCDYSTINNWQELDL